MTFSASNLVSDGDFPVPLEMQGSVSRQGPRGENLDTVQFPSAAATAEDFHTVI